MKQVMARDEACLTRTLLREVQPHAPEVGLIGDGQETSRTAPSDRTQPCTARPDMSRRYTAESWRTRGRMWGCTTTNLTTLGGSRRARVCWRAGSERRGRDGRRRREGTEDELGRRGPLTGPRSGRQMRGSSTRDISPVDGVGRLRGSMVRQGPRSTSWWYIPECLESSCLQAGG